MDKQAAIAVYVHIPYCSSKCPYCDFNSYAIDTASPSGGMPEDEYVDALQKELSFRQSDPRWQGRKISSVFFGGGTPSLFHAKSIGKVLTSLDSYFGFTPDAELTPEANPGTIQEQLGVERLSGFRSAGINRISMGVQSFRPEKLNFLGRLHSAKDAINAVENIKRAKFENFNLDLIFGVANETAKDWSYDLEQAISLAPPHLSAYGLTIESGTEFGRRARKGTLPLAEDSLQADLQLLTHETLEANSYKRYEISNYAFKDRECRHNLAYWRGQDYLGLGAGAHSFLKLENSNEVAERWSNIPKPEHYIQRAQTNGNAAQLRETVTREQAELEFLFTRIRMTEGINFKEYEQLFGRSLLQTYAKPLAELQDSSLLLLNEETIQLSPKGFLFADHILSQLAAHSPPL